MSGCDEKEVNKSFKEQLFFKNLTEKPCTKHLYSINMLRELPFYDELNIEKRPNAYRG